MKKLLLFALMLLPYWFVSCDKTVTDDPEKLFKSGEPIVTAECDNYTMDSAHLWGYVRDDYYNLGAKIGIIVTTPDDPNFIKGKYFYLNYYFPTTNRFEVYATGLSASTTYCYKAFLRTETEYFSGEAKEFTTKEFEIYGVDIGLSVKWANANVGAEAPEDYGDYFAWGELSPKPSYGWSTYLWCKGTSNSLTKYCTSNFEGVKDDKTKLDLTDDVAHVKLGGTWRMPTNKEIKELADTKKDSKYKWTWKTINGHKGWEIRQLSTD